VRGKKEEGLRRKVGGRCEKRKGGRRGDSMNEEQNNNENVAVPKA
jgi:hypothetical protein